VSDPGAGRSERFESDEPSACGAPLSDEPPAGALLGLRLGHSCHRNLVWECARVAPAAALALPELLRECGYSEQGRSPLVRELVHPREHGVVIVPRTGRVQIRVHYLTPLEAREQAACEVAREISELLARRAPARFETG